MVVVRVGTRKEAARVLLGEAHPPPRLHGRSLECCVGVLQSEPEGSIHRVAKPVHSLALEGGDLRGDVCEVSSYVFGGVCMVCGSEFPVSAHGSKGTGLGARLTGPC